MLMIKVHRIKTISLFRISLTRPIKIQLIMAIRVIVIAKTITKTTIVTPATVRTTKRK